MYVPAQHISAFERRLLSKFIEPLEALNSKDNSRLLKIHNVMTQACVESDSGHASVDKRIILLHDKIYISLTSYENMNTLRHLNGNVLNYRLNHCLIQVHEH